MLLLVSLTVFGIDPLCQDLRAQKTESANDRALWNKLRFGGMLKGGGEYRITQLILQIPKNADQKMQFGLSTKMLKDPNNGPFELPDTELKMVKIANAEIVENIQRSFQEFLRLETIGASAYGELGTIDIVTTDGTFKVRVTERGFTLGNNPPSRNNTFYNRRLAKVIDDAATRQFGKGLKREYIDLLSGQRLIDGANGD
jgi:hypothetical protein